MGRVWGLVSLVLMIVTGSPVLADQAEVRVFARAAQRVGPALPNSAPASIQLTEHGRPTPGPAAKLSPEASGFESLFRLATRMLPSGTGR